jgi:WD40 repeat protein
VRCSWLLGLNANADGSLLWLRQRGLLAHPTGTVLVLTDLASHKQRHLQHHSLPISAAAASSDGSLLATAPAGAEAASGCAEVCVWDAAACTLRFVLRQHASGVGLLAFSPDNCWLVSVSGGGAGGLLVLWDLQAGEAAAIGKTQQVSTHV